MRAGVLVVVVISLTGRVRADGPRAAPMTAEVQGHWERGLAHHAAKRYPEASEEFAACYRLEPRRECLFAWAQAARLGGDCAAAVPLYQQYASADVSAAQADAAQRQIAACAGALAAQAKASTPPPVLTAAAPPHVIHAPARSRWYTDVWGDALTGAGIAALTTSAIVYVTSGRAPSPSAPTYDRYAAQLADARRARTASIVLVGAGASLVAAGLLRYALRSDPPAPRLDVSLAATGVELRWAGAF